MRVLMTGATGFIGRGLTLRLLGAGHRVSAWVRDESWARSLLGPEVDLLCATASIQDQIDQANVVINLAGESVFAGRWTVSRKRAIVESRLGLTRQIVSAIAGSSSPPTVLISASAVGYYGDRGEEIVEDSAAPGNDFLANLCRDWEACALEAKKSGVRVFIPRIGIVLGAEEGALAKMALPFRLGVGGPIGSGRQYLAWIHLHDLIEVIFTAIDNVRMTGPMIAAAPDPVTSRQLAEAIGAVLNRPSVMPVPGRALRILLGEAAAVLLTGQRVRPRRLEQLGFAWRYPEIDSALADILKNHIPEIRRLDRSAGNPSLAADSKYLQSHRPRFVLSDKTRVEAPIEEVFQFFSKPQNLGLITPAALRFRILSTMPDQIRRGLEFEYTIQLGPIPLRWRTCIEEWQPSAWFADSQKSGPYKCWWHEHHFRSDAGATIMEDLVYYALPVSAAEALTNALLVAPLLKRIFAYRSQAMRLRFAGKRGSPGA